MKNLIKKLRISSLILGCSMFGGISYATAQTCTEPPSCKSLGYTDIEAACIGTRLLRCPFDRSQVMCAKSKIGTFDGQGLAYKQIPGAKEPIATLRPGTLTPKSGSAKDICSCSSGGEIATESEIRDAYYALFNNNTRAETEAALKATFGEGIAKNIEECNGFGCFITSTTTLSTGSYGKGQYEIEYNYTNIFKPNALTNYSTSDYPPVHPICACVVYEEVIY